MAMRIHSIHDTSYSLRKYQGQQVTLDLVYPRLEH